MSEFVEECRREWRRLGVPDPIANEMAADLTADIEEAEAEGGSAEDVLGTSVFDPRRFAAAWAGARGVTPPPVGVRPSRRRPVLALGLAAASLLVALAAVGLLIGRSSASVSARVSPLLTGPGPARLLGPGYFTGPLRAFAVGPPFGPERPLVVALAGLFLLGLAAVGLALSALCWWPWSRGRLQATTRAIGRAARREPEGR